MILSFLSMNHGLVAALILSLFTTGNSRGRGGGGSRGGGRSGGRGSSRGSTGGLSGGRRSGSQGFGRTVGRGSSGHSTRQMVTGVAAGFLAGRALRGGGLNMYGRNYYYGSRHYSESRHGYHACKHDVTNDLSFDRFRVENNATSVDSTVIFSCGRNDACCDLDCCPVHTSRWAWILIAIVLILIVGVIVYFIYRLSCRKRKKVTHSQSNTVQNDNSGQIGYSSYPQQYPVVQYNTTPSDYSTGMIMSQPAYYGQPSSNPTVAPPNYDQANQFPTQHPVNPNFNAYPNQQFNQSQFNQDESVYNYAYHKA